MAELRVEGLSFVYGAGTPYEKTAVSDVSFTIAAGEIVGVIGHTGSGKSTLMQLLPGLLRPAAGRVLLGGEDIWANEKAVRQYRFRVGLVFQYPEYQLFDETVERDIGFGPRNMGLALEEVAARVRRAAAVVGLPERLLRHSPFDLSGGEKRRAAIAGVLAMEPEVLILDEPTAGLDPAGRQTILEMIRAYNRQTGAAVLFVSHTMEDVAAVAERVLVLSAGRLALQGPPAEVFAKEEELRAASLDVPAYTRILAALRRQGFPAVRQGLYTLEEAVAEIQRLYAEGKGGATC